MHKRSRVLHVTGKATSLEKKKRTKKRRKARLPSYFLFLAAAVAAAEQAFPTAPVTGHLPASFLSFSAPPASPASSARGQSQSFGSGLDVFGGREFVGAVRPAVEAGEGKSIFFFLKRGGL